MAAVAAATVLAFSAAGASRAAASVPPCSQDDLTFQKSVDLTGTWTANDGATYWLRQIGSCLWWTGFSGPVDTVTMGRSFANVLYGTVTSKAVYGYWADVPRGGTVGSGTLTLRLSIDATRKSARLYKLAQIGSGFGGSVWTRLSAIKR
jgi:hypothetical protein